MNALLEDIEHVFFGESPARMISVRAPSTPHSLRRRDDSLRHVSNRSASSFFSAWDPSWTSASGRRRLASGWCSFGGRVAEHPSQEHEQAQPDGAPNHEEHEVVEAALEAH